jgi:hypothetical protein
MRSLLLTLLILAAGFLGAQGVYAPIGSDHAWYLDRLDIKYSKILPPQFTANNPLQRKALAKAAEKIYYSNLKYNKVQKFQLEWMMHDNAEWTDSFKSRTPKPLWKVLYTEPASFYAVKTKNFNFRINPVLAFRFGAEKDFKKLLFQNTRGVEFRADVRGVVGFYFSIYENQMRPFNFVRKNYEFGEYKFVPGNAYWKPYRTTGVDYFQVRGYVNVNALKYFNIQLGHDKFFIGNGIRSLFLSDFSAPVFFLRLNTRIWKFNYQNIFTELTNQYVRGGDRLLVKKYAAFHHLTVNVTHFLDIGFFEGVVFNRKDHFELQYLNPLIFYRAIEQSLGSPDNALVGMDIKANIVNRMQVYGQLVIDEFNFGELMKRKGWYGNKFGFQLGIKAIDIAPNLDMQLEFNTVRPYTYTHKSTSNYTHYNQPLAHPLGANFYELSGILRYQPIPQLTAQLRAFYARLGEDTLVPSQGPTHFGSDIFRGTNSLTVQSVYGNKTAQGVPVNQSTIHLLFTYQPWHNLMVDLEMFYRNRSSAVEKISLNTLYGGIGVRYNFAPVRFEY